MKKAGHPSEIPELFLAYVASGDLEGVLSLFEEDALVATGPGGQVARGKKDLRNYFAHLLAQKPKFDTVHHRKPLINGDLALTSSRLPQAFTTVEIARRQADGSWLWCIDQPHIDADEAKAHAKEQTDTH